MSIPAAALGRGWSFVCTWALLMAYSVVCLFESVALPTAVEYLFPEIRIATLWHVLDAPVHLGFVAMGVGAAVIMTWINVVGIRTAAFVQSTITGAILLAGVVLLTGAFGGDWSNAQPLIGIPATGILTVLIMVPALMGGLRRPAAVCGRNRPAREPDRMAADRLDCHGRRLVRGHLLRRCPRARRGGARRLDGCDRGRGHRALGRIVGRRRADRRGHRRHTHELECVHHLRQPGDVRVVGVPASFPVRSRGCIRNTARRGSA